MANLKFKKKIKLFYKARPDDRAIAVLLIQLINRIYRRINFAYKIIMKTSSTTMPNFSLLWPEQTLYNAELKKVW